MSSRGCLGCSAESRPQEGRARLGAGWRPGMERDVGTLDPVGAGEGLRALGFQTDGIC